MENTLRSQRTRETALRAALTIITRDGPARLTIDAIAREGGISKGGVLHQFGTKEAVLKALLEYQINKGERLVDETLGQIGPDRDEPMLAAQISALRNASFHPRSTSFAIAGALAESPDLLGTIRKTEGKRVDEMRRQAADPRVALVRWSAAKGLALASILGLCPLSEQERMELFSYLEDDGNWPGKKESPAKRRKARAAK